MGVSTLPFVGIFFFHNIEIVKKINKQTNSRINEKKNYEKKMRAAIPINATLLRDLN